MLVLQNLEQSWASANSALNNTTQIQLSANGIDAEWGSLTLRQACYRENPEAQCAFKI
jgi:hypothetical protein